MQDPYDNWTEAEEEDFNLWLDSIEFVHKDGSPYPIVLMEDTSQDPEGDRA